MDNETMKQLIQTRIRNARFDAELSQMQIEAYDGIKQSTVSQWESGLIPFAVVALGKMAKRYQVSADYLLGLTDAPDPAAQSAIPVDAIQMAELFVKLDAQKRGIVLDLARSLSLLSQPFDVLVDVLADLVPADVSIA
jgi:transcriptional regulator with XRE-family HTH domain